MNASFMVKRFSHPWMPMALYLPVGVLLTTLSLNASPRPWTGVVLWILAGIFSWSLIEYFLHRFIFHWVEVKEPWRTLASGLHMAHHKSANTEDLILAPPGVSLVFGGFVYLVFSLFTWSFATAALMEVGVFLGYLAYEWIHYGAHRYQWNFKVGQYMKHYHLHHHFKEPRRVYGVTSPLWDWVFGSLPNKFSFRG